ncbi:MAG: hypothetical protein AAB407_02110 [Patescibacteria group bacterium]
MNSDQAIKTLNKVLLRKNPPTFNSSWICKYIPPVYRFIQKNIRTELGAIDWDRVTYAIEWKFQRRWSPGRTRRSRTPYKDPNETKTIIDKYKEKFYVFIAVKDIEERRIRDIIAISLVRIAQQGNIAAEEELLKLINYTIDEWLERYYFLSRWRGYDEEIQEKLKGCIRRYRYTGSFLNYVFRTLEYAGRGIRPFYAYSLDEPLCPGADKLKIEDVVQDTETGEAHVYNNSTVQH